MLSRRLVNQYHLIVEDGLPEIIADDLLADRGSPVAPTLQTLLTSMWAAARKKDTARPFFSKTLYQEMQEQGILLKDVLDRQIESIKQANRADVESGLALDLLNFHTTSLSTSAVRDRGELLETYGQIEPRSLIALLQLCQQRLLLVHAKGEDELSPTRLQHDTLAPLIRELYANSTYPGQRARRLLDNRVVEWSKGQGGNPLDAADLALVESGRLGTRELDQGRAADGGGRPARAAEGKGQRIGIVVALAVLAFIALAMGIAFEAKSSADRQVREKENQSKVDARTAAGITATSRGRPIEALHEFARAIGQSRRVRPEEPSRRSRLSQRAPDAARLPHTRGALG